MPAPVRIELWGGLRAFAEGRLVARFRTRRAALLLARLALEPRMHAREALIEWLWPDAGFEAGRGRLSGALSVLRRDLGAQFLSNHDAVGLDFARVATDVGEWESLLREDAPVDEYARLSRAVEEWKGPLLVGLEDGVLASHTRRLEEIYFGALRRLAEIAPSDDPFVLGQLRRAQEAAPAREEIARPLMHALSVVEGPRAALRQFRSLQEELRRNGSRVPTPATQELARELSLQLRDVSPVPNADNSRLPRLTGQFFGRETDLETALALMAPGGEAPLLSLVGGGGVGKTRLSLEIARRLSGAWKGEVFFVPLADVPDAARLGDAILDGLGKPRVPGVAALDLVVAALQTPTLLVLDNFEHLLPDGAGVLLPLLGGAPRSRLLVTSRRPLRVGGERQLSVAPLPIPDLGDANSWNTNPSVRLFAARARLARPELRMGDELEAMARLCAALEGVPLALELAAARVGALSLSQIEALLRERLDVLQALQERANGGPPRHASVRAALDWSFDLLPADVGRLFRALCVFRGGWTLEIARFVCPSPRGAGALWLEDSLELLRSHSLLQARDEGESLRFGFLETVRTYAQERHKRDEKPSVRRATHERHARAFVALACDATQSGASAGFDAPGPQLEREGANLRAALEWALEDQPALALEGAASSWWFWFLSSDLSQGRQWLARALEASAEVGEERAGEAPLPTVKTWAQCGAGFLAWRQGDLVAARTWSQASLEGSRALGDKRGVAYSLIPLQMTALVRSDYALARASGEESLALGRELGDQVVQGFALHLLGSGHEMTGDLERAWSLQEQSCTLFQTLGSRDGVAFTSFNWGSAARRRGKLARAIELCEQGRALFEELSNREGQGYCLVYGARAHLENGDAGRAGVELRAGLKSLWDVRALWGVALALETLAMIEARAETEAGWTRAARLWGAAQKTREQIGAPIPPVDKDEFAAFEARLHAQLDAPVWEAGWESGRTLTLEQNVKWALGQAPPAR